MSYETERNKCSTRAIVKVCVSTEEGIIKNSLIWTKFWRISRIFVKQQNVGHWDSMEYRDYSESIQHVFDVPSIIYAFMIQGLAK